MEQWRKNCLKEGVTINKKTLLVICILFIIPIVLSQTSSTVTRILPASVPVNSAFNTTLNVTVSSNDHSYFIDEKYPSEFTIVNP